MQPGSHQKDKLSAKFSSLFRLFLLFIEFRGHHLTAGVRYLLLLPLEEGDVDAASVNYHNITPTEYR